jgi:hypothetical protein
VAAHPHPVLGTPVRLLSRRTIAASRAGAAILAVAALAMGCLFSTQQISATPDRRLFNASELSFVREGETTREQVLFRLGNPASRFEGDRILIYQVGFETDGRVHVYAPRILSPSGLQDWVRGSYSLVLVFRDDGVLRSFSLVGSE